MTTAKLFQNGRSQAVRLPKEFRFEETDEVFIKKIDKMVVLISKKELKNIFLHSLSLFPDDFDIDRQNDIPEREIQL